MRFQARAGLIAAHVVTVGLGVCVAVDIAGCAHYNPSPIVPEEAVAAFEERTLDDGGLRSFVSPAVDGSRPSQWNLSSLTLAAIYFSPELDVARARWHSSRAAVLTAAQMPNPSLHLSAGYASNPPNGESPGLADIGLEIPIETAGKRGYRVSHAEHLSDAARFDVRNTAWQLRARVRSGVLEWKAAAARAELLAKQVGVEESIVAMLAKRFAVGAVSSGEVMQSRVALAQVRLELANGRRDIEQAKARLAATIGIPVAALERANVSFDGLTGLDRSMSLADLRRAGLFHRADLQSALAAHAAAESALQLEIARQYPDINLAPIYAFDTGINKFSLGINSLTLPVFNRNEGPIAEAKAHRLETAAKFEAVQATVIAELDQAFAQEELARQKLALADSLLQSDRQRIEKLKSAFNVGETDRLELAQATRSSYAAEIARVDAVLADQQAIGQLEDAAQTPILEGALLDRPELSPRGEPR